MTTNEGGETPRSLEFSGSHMYFLQTETFKQHLQKTTVRQQRTQLTVQKIQQPAAFLSVLYDSPWELELELLPRAWETGQQQSVSSFSFALFG
jgi:hypothetical protein